MRVDEQRNVIEIAFIGAGKMAEAIIGSIIRADVVAPTEVVISDPSEERVAAMTGQFGVSSATSNVQVVDGAEVVVLAVKPQMLDEVLSGMAEALAGKLVISIAAGKKVAYFEGLLAGSRIVRVMPNLPCLVGEGATAYCGGRAMTEEDRICVEALLNAFGKVLALPEDQFDGLTALSGSGPAFFAYMAAGMAGAAEEEGLSADDARMLSIQTMLGTAKLLLDQDLDPAELIASVSSAKGTTAEGMGVLRESSLHAILRDTVAAAARRSRELSEQS